nr:hypothetical protein [Tanacetum cinerariifolium]
GGDSLVRAATTASLDAQQDNSNIAKTQSKAILNEPNPQGKGSGSGLGCQETIEGAMAQIRPEGAPIQSSGLLLSTSNTVRSGEDRMEHEIELTDHRHSLGRRTVSKQGRKNLKSQQKFQDIDDLVDEGMNFVLDKDADKTKEFNLDVDIEVIVTDKGSGEKGGSTAETVSTVRPDISAARPEVSTAKPKTPPTTTTLFDDEDVIIADTLVKIKSQKAKEKGVAFKDIDDSARPIRSITTLQPFPTIDPKDKVKGSEEDEKRVGSRNKRAPGPSSKQTSPKKQKVNDQESIDIDKNLGNV